MTALHIYKMIMKINVTIFNPLHFSKTRSGSDLNMGWKDRAHFEAENRKV